MSIHIIYEIRLDTDTRRLLSDFLDKLARLAAGVPLPPLPAAAPDAGVEGVPVPPPAPTPAGPREPAGVDGIPVPVEGALSHAAPAAVALGASAQARPPCLPPPAVAPRRKWSDERNAVLRRDYPAGVQSAVIVARLNALQGERVELTQIPVQAAAIGLKRPEGFRRALVNGFALGSSSPPPADPGTREVDDAQALHWGQQRGMFTDGRVDWALLQKKQRELGAPVMVRREPARRGGGAYA